MLNHKKPMLHVQQNPLQGNTVLHLVNKTITLCEEKK
jgi:hypothetical protein